MADFVACPFCRELFVRGEAQTCPACGLALKDASKLPLSHDARAEVAPGEDAFGLPLRPDLEPLPWSFVGRGRGALAGCAVAGICVFFGPWVHMTSPEIQVLSGGFLAQRTGWTWGAAVAWFVLLPIALSRRSIDQMRGARVAAAFLSAVPVVTTLILFVKPPHSRYVPIRYDWGWGIHATFVLGLLAFLIAIRFGGRADDISWKHGPSGTSRKLLH